jgi:hypothetical protein
MRAVGVPKIRRPRGGPVIFRTSGLSGPGSCTGASIRLSSVSVPIAAPPFGSLQSGESNERGGNALMTLKPCSAAGAKPSPVPHQQRAAEQVEIDSKRVETLFVFLRSHANERNTAVGGLDGGMFRQYFAL